ncbi:MAG: hypothetical protein ACYTGK_16670, partial [Planctomycetota bacterium]
MLLPVLAATVATLVAGAYFGGGVRRAVREVRRARRGARREIRRAEKVLTSRERALKQTARRYAEAQVQRRLADVPLDTLREQTDRKVKVAPLQEAGYATVGDLLGKSRRELRAVRGIGPVSARALEQAVKEYAQTARTIAPELPQPELEEPRALDLARDGLVYLDAWRELGESPDAMRQGLATVDARVKPELKGAAFLPWLA